MRLTDHSPLPQNQVLVDLGVAVEPVWVPDDYRRGIPVTETHL